MKTKEQPETYGYSKKMDLVHYFRKGKVIHQTSGNGGHAWLFHAKPGWDPSHPFTCPECKKILEQEEKEKQALSPLSPLSPPS